MQESLPNVQADQIWEDCDRRAEGRRLKVLRVLEEYRYPHPRPILLAECEVIREKGGAIPQKPKKVKITVERMKPTSTGYRLLGDVNDY